jgi:hypothetical protein
MRQAVALEEVRGAMPPPSNGNCTDQAEVFFSPLSPGMPMQRIHGKSSYHVEANPDLQSLAQEARLKFACKTRGYGVIFPNSVSALAIRSSKWLIAKSNVFLLANSAPACFNCSIGYP